MAAVRRMCRMKEIVPSVLKGLSSRTERQGPELVAQPTLGCDLPAVWNEVFC
jgi:hypothetical protein